MNFHPASLPTLQRVKIFFSKQFSTDLVGIYLHSSLVTGCYNPKLSDIDFIVVIKHPLTPELRRCIIDFSIELDENAPGKGIEYSILTLDQIRDLTYPTPNELTFSYHSLDDHTKEEMYSTHPEPDPDLVAHFAHVMDRGVALQGAPIEEIFKPVSREYVLRALTSDLEYIKTMIERKPFYGILNLCRIYAYKRDSIILSKKEGGEWALQHMDRKYHPLITKALADYETQMTTGWDSLQLHAFVDHMNDLIAA